MARPRSEAKRESILQAALLEFAESGLAAPTAAIAARAGVAAGTLFTYFATKELLQNQLYLMLKSEVYGRMNDGFPVRGSLEARLRHMWGASLGWAFELPAKRKLSMQLTLSTVLTPHTRQTATAMSGPAAQALVDLEARGRKRGLPRGYAAGSMSALQDAALHLLAAAETRQRPAITRSCFDAFWRMVR